MRDWNVVVTVQEHGYRRAIELLRDFRAVGKQANVDFSDPDLIIALETVAQVGGLSLWNREQRQRYALLKLD
jgi:tRNA(Ser,Leu) C12 N-acetylase TAN1